MSNSSTVKSHSLTVSCVSETTFNQRLLRKTTRPLSLDLSYHSEQTFSKTSIESILNTSSSTNSLPLPPRRRRDRIYSLQGDEPPPRHLLGPKPVRFKAVSADFNLFSDNIRTKLSIPPIIEVTKPIEAPAEEVDNCFEDNFVLDDVFIDDVPDDRTETEDVASGLDEGQIRFIDDTSPEATDVEALPANNGSIDSDVESQRSIPMERFDTDSQIDIISESSVDTVATAIEVRERAATLPTAEAHNYTEDNLFIIHNPRYDSLNRYDLMTTERKLSVIDESNPKLAKDLKNKMSRERLSKNLAAEITDFFKSSASKLKPPCMDQGKRGCGNKKPKIDRDVAEPAYKTPQRLIPRSPYITPVPAFEPKVSPRKAPPAKQPPFYVWNINSKNAAVCTTLNPSCSYKTSANEEFKAFKDIENSTRKILHLPNRVNGATVIHISPPKPARRDLKSASTGQLSTKAQRDARKSNSDSYDLKPKQRHSSAKTKSIVRPRPSPSRLLYPTTSPWDVAPPRPQGRPLRLPPKNLSKINIPLPTPNITVAEVKTQLPCDFVTSRTRDNLTNPRPSTSRESVSPNVVPEPVTKKSWVKKWKSVIQNIYRRHQVEFYINGVPACYNCKRSNTWPPKNNPFSDDMSVYMLFKK